MDLIPQYVDLIHKSWIWSAQKIEDLNRKPQRCGSVDQMLLVPSGLRLPTKIDCRIWMGIVLEIPVVKLLDLQDIDTPNICGIAKLA